MPSKLNIVGQCRSRNLPLLQCPQFIFLMMGVVIIFAILIAYAIARQIINDPLFVSLSVIALAVVLLILDFLITRSFDRLAKAFEMKSQFIGIVSHQLRSPLSNLRWSVEALQDALPDDINEEAQEYADVLQHNTQRMRDLLSNLLTASRIQEGRIPVTVQSFSLEDVVKESREQYASTAGEHYVTIDVTTDDDISPVAADPIHTRHAVNNLLENAIQYSKGDEREVHISLTQPEPEWVKCTVSDKGIGIPDDEKPYIFSRFFRGKQAMRNNTQGSGLGLYIVKALIEQMDGRVGFSSTEEAGSTFWFALPTAKE